MQYIASLSYGKDSLAMLKVIKQHNMPLDRIVHSEVWATDDIPAEVPEMVELKHISRLFLHAPRQNWKKI